LFKDEENDDFKDYLNFESKDYESEGSKSQQSNLGEYKPLFQRFLKMTHKVLDIFENQPLSSSPEAYHIERKYPKYLAEYKLINLQFNDFQFRQTFMIQILVLLQSLKQPVNQVQTKYFKISNFGALAQIKNRIYSILNNEAKPQQMLKDDEDKESIDTNINIVDSSGMLIILTYLSYKKFLAKNSTHKMIAQGISRILTSDKSWVSIIKTSPPILAYFN